MDLGFKLVGLVLILVIGFRISKIIIKLLNKGKGFNKLEKSVRTFVLSFVNIALKVFIFVTALSYIGVPMTSILTVVGTATLAIGLALQGGLTNMVGGILILVFKPFKIGDYIETGDSSGTVQEISIFYTTLTTPNNQRIVIPNGPLSNQSITNYSYNSDRKLELKFSVGYNSDIDKVKKVIKDVIDKEDTVIKDKEIFIRLTAQADSALIFTVRVWAKNSDYWNLNFNLQEKIKTAFDENNIEIPYPQLDVHIENSDANRHFKGVYFLLIICSIYIFNYMKICF